MEPEFAVHRNDSPSPDTEGSSAPTAPTAEDWAVLVAGNASPWLREQLLGEMERNPDAARGVAIALEPSHRDAVEEAGGILHPERLQTGLRKGRKPRVVQATMTAPEPPPVRDDARTIEIRLRPDSTFLWLGTAAMLGAYLFEGFGVQLLIGGTIAFVCYLMDYQQTRPLTLVAKARRDGDHAQAEAILEAYARKTGS